METTPTNKSEREPVHMGMHYLELLELGHLANHIMPKSGKPLSEFLDVCGDHATDYLVGLDATERDDPDFATTQAFLQNYVQVHLVGLKEATPEVQ